MNCGHLKMELRLVRLSQKMSTKRTSKYSLPRNEWPAYLRSYQQLAGICVGGCIRDRDARFYRSKDNKRIALAHCHPRGKYAGWICVPYETRLRTRNLMLHELAHIICGSLGIKRGHKKEWRTIVKAIGGTAGSYKIVGSTLKSRDHREFVEKIWDWIAEL